MCEILLSCFGESPPCGGVCYRSIKDKKLMADQRRSKSHHFVFYCKEPVADPFDLYFGLWGFLGFCTFESYLDSGLAHHHLPSGLVTVFTREGIFLYHVICSAFLYYTFVTFLMMFTCTSAKSRISLSLLPRYLTKRLIMQAMPDLGTKMCIWRG